ncbi:MAG: transposase [Candidatus Omnitrophica bacterium]|nr:transposase [Candidatus Omnitrophota bacterium]
MVEIKTSNKPIQRTVNLRFPAAEFECYRQIKMQKLITRKQIRLKNYNYGLNGYYFVTICSKNRENIFWKYKISVGAALAPARYENNINLSIIGTIIDNQWKDIPNQYNDVQLDQYIIMPNHIHGILIINNNHGGYRAQASSAPTVSQIIRSFKSKSTMKYLKYINDNDLNISGKIWQRSFYDRIIRNGRSLGAIREYISNNPVNWEKDIDNLINL